MLIILDANRFYISVLKYQPLSVKFRRLKIDQFPPFYRQDYHSIKRADTALEDYQSPPVLFAFSISKSFPHSICPNLPLCMVLLLLQHHAATYTSLSHWYQTCLTPLRRYVQHIIKKICANRSKCCTFSDAVQMQGIWSLERKLKSLYRAKKKKKQEESKGIYLCFLNLYCK